jgi:hypothetical protein
MLENFGQFAMSESKLQTRPRGNWVITEYEKAGMG